MSDINIVMLTGNLTRDAELLGAVGGASVLKFGLASNRTVKNQQTDSYEDVPNFIDCTIFGKRADALADILTKGMRVSLEGELRYSSWQAKDGSRRSKLEVVVHNIILPPMAKSQDYSKPQRPAYTAAAPTQTPPRPAQQPQTYQQQQLPTYTPAPPAAPYSAPQQSPAPDVYDEDIPF